MPSNIRGAWRVCHSAADGRGGVHDGIPDSLRSAPAPPRPRFCNGVQGQLGCRPSVTCAAISRRAERGRSANPSRPVRRPRCSSSTSTIFPGSTPPGGHRPATRCSPQRRSASKASPRSDWAGPSCGSAAMAGRLDARSFRHHRAGYRRRRGSEVPPSNSSGSWRSPLTVSGQDRSWWAPARR